MIEIKTPETPREEMQNYINRMNDYQLRIVLGFIKKLFNLPD